MCHEQLHQVYLRATKPRLLKTLALQLPQPQLRQPHTYLAPVGRRMQWLPAVAVLGAQAGPVFQQQGSRLTEPIGSSNV